MSENFIASNAEPDFRWDEYAADAGDGGARAKASARTANPVGVAAAKLNYSGPRAASKTAP